MKCPAARVGTGLTGLQAGDILIEHCPPSRAHFLALATRD
jgi:hypothetical protein